MSISGVGTGLDAQLGFAEEVTYGTFVSPTRYYEFNSQSLVPDVQVLEREAALGRGRFRRAADPRTFINGGSGDFTIDVLTKGAGLLFKHMLGDHKAEQVGASDEYLHTIVPDDYGLRGLSLSVQAGVPMTDTGARQPFNFAGGKITSWTLACALDQILTLQASMDFSQAFEMSSALGIPVYPSDAQPFIFVDGSIKIDDEAVFVNNASVTGTNALATNRRGLGNVKREPLANARWEYAGALTGEFENPDFLEAFINGTPASFVMHFEADEIPEGDGGKFGLTVSLPVIRFTGTVPSVGGPDVVPQEMPFRAYEDEEPIITIEYRTTDVAA